MNLRPAERDDRADIRAVAERSFQASYSLSPDQIEAIVEEVFSDDSLDARFEDADGLFYVAEEGGDVLGFAEVDGTDRALRWLHVDPDARGQGIGTALVERVRTDLTERGQAFTARVLEEASEGGEFLSRFGLHQSGSAHFEFDGERFVEQVYTTAGDDHDANEPAVEVPERVRIDGAERLVDRTEEIPGTEAPFFPIYADEGRAERFGFFCSNCASTDVSADSLDRLECDNCGNRHLADSWDAAYL